MTSLLFSAQGRINRSRFWFGLLVQIAVSLAVVVLLVGLAKGTGVWTEEDSFDVEGVEALPYAAIIFGWLVGLVWSGVCLAVKRYHDRDKSGFWMLVTFIPVIGNLWYAIETGFLPGTSGPNRFGPDPLGGVPPAAYAV